MTYSYTQPAANCLTSTNPLACGQLLAAQFPNDPFNRARRPVPATFRLPHRSRARLKTR